MKQVLKKKSGKGTFLAEWGLSGSVVLLCAVIWVGMLCGLVILLQEVYIVQFNASCEDAQEFDGNSIPPSPGETTSSGLCRRHGYCGGSRPPARGKAPTNRLGLRESFISNTAK
jgi:hypothetical protein